MENEKNNNKESLLSLMIKQSKEGDEFLEAWDRVAKEMGLPSNQEILEMEKKRMEKE